MRVINSFGSEYSFLSNFYPSRIEFRGDLYATVEHAFQAAKTTSGEERRWIRQNSDPAEAKRRGQKVTLRPDWDDVDPQDIPEKVRVMEAILRIKFAFGSKLAQKLLDTGDADLVEGNRHGDVFWGVCRGAGSNWLGRILMRVRSDLRKQQQRAA